MIVIETKFDEHTHKLDEHTRTLGEHSKSLAKLEINVEVLKGNVQQIAEGHAATQAAIAREADRIIEHIDHRVGHLERLFTTPMRGGGEGGYAVSSNGRFLVNVPVAGSVQPPITVFLNWASSVRK